MPVDTASSASVIMPRKSLRKLAGAITCRGGRFHDLSTDGDTCRVVFMTDVYVDLRLRPVRVGFLVRPNDTKSILAFMRASSCVWGGMYHPIIPVFRTPPKEWKREAFESARGADIAKGYVRFFEPDVYIEAEQGLLEEVGLGSLREGRHFEPRVGSLKEFLSAHDNRAWAETLFGLEILDVMRSLYETEHRFKMRDERTTFLVRPDADSGLVEAIFGTYPEGDETKHIKENYLDVFEAKEVDASPELWIKTFKHRAMVPLYLTQHGIERTRHWHHEKLIYVFDPARSTDLIDLWNMRMEPNPILPIPKQWFTFLLENVREIIKSEYRPIRGNPSGLMHRVTIEFGRSMPEAEVQRAVHALGSDLPQNSVSVKLWRNRVWAHPGDGIQPRAERMKLTAESRRSIIAVKEGDESYGSFETLTPSFASQYGRSQFRWANVAKITTYGVGNFATALPFNTFENSWPRIGATRDAPNIGAEGWVFRQRYKNSTEGIHFLSCEEAITQFLKLRGIEAKLSEPGHIAKQMLEHLGDPRNVRLIADKQTVELLNSMANSVRRKSNDQDTVEETFEGRRTDVKKWHDLVERRKKDSVFPRVSLEDFTKKNVIRLGLVTKCPHCQFANWHGLDKVDYKIACERCLKIYEFPQAGLKTHNKNWEYRVIGRIHPA